MSVSFILNVLFVVNLIHTSVSLNCEPEEHGTRYVNYNSIICSNVTFQTVDDFGNSTTTVTSLSIQSSSIKKLPSNIFFSKLTQLENLELSSLGVEEIAPGAFDGLVHLTELDLSGNRICGIVQGLFSDLEELEELNLDQNLLETIPEGVFGNLSSLRRLFLQDNLINKIEDNAFAGVVSLTDLYLERNNLSILQDSLFEDLIKLERIGLSENPLVEIGNVGFCKKIDELNLEDTLLEEWKLGTISHPVKNLKIINTLLKRFDFNTVLASRYSSEIRLSSNEITVIENLEKTNFSHVYLDRNSITEIPDISKRITDLFLSHNKIKDLRYTTEPEKLRLSKLDLSYNEIDTATCFGIRSVKFLDLSHNHITVVTKDNFNICTGLYDLNLSGNQIQSIDAHAFKNLDWLHNLDISDNKLTQFNYDSFIGLKNIEQFYFKKNEIGFIDIKLLFKNMPKMQLTDFNTSSLFCSDLNDIFRIIRLHHLRHNYESHLTNTDCKKKT